MKKIILRACFIGFFAGLPLACTNTSPDQLVFCVKPGSSVATMHKLCESIKTITEHTEEGEVETYVVSSGIYTANVETGNGAVELIRFKENPLPYPGVKIGDSFATVKKATSGLELIADAAEEGYLALADEEQGLYISFDVSQVPTDWYFKRPYDESKIKDMKVVSLTFAAPTTH